MTHAFINNRVLLVAMIDQIDNMHDVNQLLLHKCVHIVAHSFSHLVQCILVGTKLLDVLQEF